MTTKEIILILVAGATLLLVLSTFYKLSKLDIGSEKKTTYKVITILIPIIGFFMVRKEYNKSLKNH